MENIVIANTSYTPGTLVTNNLKMRQTNAKGRDQSLQETKNLGIQSDFIFPLPIPLSL